MTLLMRAVILLLLISFVGDSFTCMGGLHGRHGAMGF